MCAVGGAAAEIALSGCILCSKSRETLCLFVAENVPTESNLRGSAAYRTHLIRVLVERAMTGLRGM